MTRNIEALQQARRVALEAPSDELYDLSLVTRNKSCGTAHCQYGWMKFDPWFLGKFGGNPLFVSMNEMGILLGLTVEDFDVLFAFGTNDTSSRKGLSAKTRVIHNIDRLIAGDNPIRYRSKRWADIDLSAIHAEIEAFDQSKTEAKL